MTHMRYGGIPARELASDFKGWWELFGESATKGALERSAS